jgi:hypothetical protein
MPVVYPAGFTHAHREAGMMLGFEKRAIDLTIEDWTKIEKYNECLEQMIKRRKPEVTATGDLLESKTAWKCAVLQQSLLCRISEVPRPVDRSTLVGARH